MKKQALLLIGISVFWLALSMVSDGVNTLLLPGMILERFGEQRSATLLGLVTFVGLLVGALFQPYAGAWSDRLYPRWGRKGMIALGTLLLLISMAFTGLAGNVTLIVAGYLLVQLSLNLAQAAQQGFVPDLAPARRRGAASGLKFFMDMAGAMLGFVVLGSLLGQGGPATAIIALSLALLVTLGLTFLLVRERTTSHTAAPGQRPPARAAWIDAFRIDLHTHRRFAWLVAARFLFLLGTFAVGRFLLLFVASRLGLDAAEAAEQAGWLLAGLALATVLAAVPAGWAADRFGRVPLMRAGAAAAGLGVLLLIFAHSAWQILAFGALMSIGNAAFVSANWAMTADLAPRSQAARFFGLANLGAGGATAAAGLFGPLVDWGNSLQPGAGFALLFSASAGAIALSALALREVKTNRRRCEKYILDACIAETEPLEIEELLLMEEGGNGNGRKN